jgi:pimeloyl-ACP methyl ester carboxylesterase
MRPRCASVVVFMLGAGLAPFAVLAPWASMSAHAQARVTADSTERLATSTSGAGSSVVFVPGVLGSAYTFRKVIPPLVAAGFGVTVVDPLGFGASPHPDGADYSFTAQSNRIARTLDGMRLSHVILVCHALSGSICYRLAYRRPDLVRGIVSINGGSSEQAGTTEMRFALKLARVVLFFAGRSFAVRKVKDGLIDSSGDASWVSDSVVARYVAPFGPDPRVVVKTMSQIVSAHEPEALKPRLHAVRAPVLLLYGAGPRNPRNPALSVEERETLKSGVPHFEQEDVAGAGQYIQEEQPARVIDAVKKIFTKTAS